MSGRGGYSKEPVKVVIISTQYVQTDAGNFKSVVQKLTGKDSHDHDDQVEEEPASSSASRKAINSSEAKAESHHHEVSGSVFIRDVSFKEFDRMLREMPPIHEIWENPKIFGSFGRNNKHIKSYHPFVYRGKRYAMFY
ncbi:VQ motif-containing protein 1 [Prosopis cineraria]|uniref:VQ motif-containing protein 1 n=1 Tax=Prosopis cineraria TaxID=364024 RepID=UPI002410434F|nr:VQ motif-containing protein 1 [Prosopis cineraria]